MQHVSSYLSMGFPCFHSLCLSTHIDTLSIVLIGCEASGRASPLPGFCTENYGKPPRPHRTDSPVPRFDCMKSKCVSMASQIVDIRPPSRMAERPASVANLERPASRNLVDRLPLEKIKQEMSRNLPREVEKESPFTSTDHPTTSNDDLTSSDVEDSSELTRSVFSDTESLGSKGTCNQLPSTSRVWFA